MKTLQLPSTYSPTCLITTITYGTPYFNMLNYVRAIRDNQLSKLGMIGNIIINVYYSFGSLIASKVYLNKLLKSVLLPFVFFLIKISAHIEK